MSSSKSNMVFVATSDLAGLVRGKSFPVSEWEKRSVRGVGWTPTNVQITCFDTIADSPFGSLGDLALVPDPATRFQMGAPGNAVDIALGDIESLEGEPWDFCTRSIAKRALRELHDLSGVTVLSAFEHEFQLMDAPVRAGDSFGLKGFRDGQAWAEALIAELDRTSCKPDTFMKEYGPSQYEITNKPATGIVSADNAVILRILTDDVLRRFGVASSFSPILDPDGVGNGVHIHFSFVDDDGTPLTHDASTPYGMSDLTRHFIGGVLKYLDQIMALLAPSEISYLRLTPHRWSAAFNNLGYRDREASVRICPVSGRDEEAIARQYNFEVRAVDAAASPYLAYAAIVFAGTQGLRDRIEPQAPTQEDLSLLAPEELASRGFRRLPQTLVDALDALDGSKAVRTWFGDDFVNVYLAHKKEELAQLEGLEWQEKCNRYKEVY
ncbi:glutamine synthetase family protein [Hoeflea sp.]|uniref:glutamine synthetase family protein n=1 Tax=Hoeflea sp. TaxID=1940281 RepID=UPI00199C74AC|nr:glutamine synthetase family protein [Hoeflea sp.]MBC7284527.1 glutamine synthetase [Hoeflea sp.]